jgi:hypothetical protein
VIGYYTRKNRILYREDELLSYINESLKRSYSAPCLKSLCSGLDHIGEATLPDQKTSIASGMTPDQERSAAALLRQQMSKRLKDTQPPSGSQKLRLRLVPPKT